MNLNLKGHQNRITGSKVTAILLNGGILPTGGDASERVCPAACAAGLLDFFFLHFAKPSKYMAIALFTWEKV